jgi:hypothetical protein
MEFSPRAAKLTTLLESRITNFYTNLKVDNLLQGINNGFTLRYLFLPHSDVGYFSCIASIFFFYAVWLACGWVKKLYMEGQEAFDTSVSPSGHQGRTRTRAQRHSSFCWFIVHSGLVTLCFGVN